MSIKRINNKGFTLVELLAVIVILAVLLLLAMPRALEIMENARKNAFETEVRSFLKAAETKYTEMAIVSTSRNRCFYGSGSVSSLDIDLKSGYSYKIAVKYDTSNGGLSYMYFITNGENYYAQKSDAYVKYGDAIEVKPVDADSIAAPATCTNDTTAGAWPNLST